MNEEAVLDSIENECFYCWHTTCAAYNNSTTMDLFLNYHLPDYFEVSYLDGSYAEIISNRTNNKYCVVACGDGDFCNHKVLFKAYTDE